MKPPDRARIIPTGRLVSATSKTRQIPVHHVAAARRDRWPMHLIAGMAAVLGALLIVTFAVAAAVGFPSNALEIVNTVPTIEQPPPTIDPLPPVRTPPVVTGVTPDVPAGPEALGVAPREVVIGPEAGPFPREIVIRIEAHPAASAGPNPPKKPPEVACGKFGTRIAFEASCPDAFAQARKSNKLVFVLHLSGNFEDSGFT